MSDVLAVVFLVDSSLTLSSEWISIATDYVAPHTNQICNTCPDFQLRAAFVSYGLSSSRPGPILHKRWFQKLEQLRDDALHNPSKLGIGWTGPESDSRGMAVLEGLVAGLELFDLLHKLTDSARNGSKQPRFLFHMIHVAACPPDTLRNPTWNNSSDFDHISWDMLPKEFRQRGVRYSLILLRPLPRLQRTFFSICPASEIIAPWFLVRPHHICLLSSPSKESANSLRSVCGFPSALSMTSANRTLPSFTGLAQQWLLERYRRLKTDIDRFDAASRGGRTAEAQSLQAHLANEFPFYLELHEYFTSLTVSPGITLGDADALVDVNNSRISNVPDRGLDSESGSSPEAMSVFHMSDSSSFEGCVTLHQQGPFGINLSDYPPRVITQMYTLQGSNSPILGGSCWQGDFSWTGLDPNTGDRKYMTIGVLGLNPVGGRDLRPHTWPRHLVLTPSSEKQVSESDLQVWIKKYDPVWCQFVPSPKPGTCATLNDIVFRQLVGRLTDRNLYALASWHLRSGGGMHGNLVLIPFGTSGLVGAVFSSRGKPDMPKPNRFSQLECNQTEGSPESTLYKAVARNYPATWCEDPMSSSSSNRSEPACSPTMDIDGGIQPHELREQTYSSPSGYNPTQSQDQDSFVPAGHAGDHMHKFDGYQDSTDSSLHDAKMIRQLIAEGMIEAAVPLSE